MWRKKRKEAPTEDEPRLEDIVPMVHHERIVLPERLRTKAKPESPEDVRARTNIAKRFTVDLEKSRQVEEVLKMNKHEE